MKKLLHGATYPAFIFLASVLLTWTVPGSGRAQDTNPGGIGPKPFIDYFLPIPITGSLSKDVWGAASVGPRDAMNGLEDTTMKKWNYWDGKILKGPDGRCYLFVDRWDQAKGHNDWPESKTVEAVSSTPLGPYVDQGLLWPDNQGGKGCNVTALEMPDHGGYAVVVSETRDGDIFTSRAITGPFTQLGTITVTGKANWHGSNVSLIARPDGGFEIIQRYGQVMTSPNILGPYEVRSGNIYQGLVGVPQNFPSLEDPVIWYSGGLYHIVVNSWMDRKAYHLISVDGIKD